MPKNICPNCGSNDCKTLEVLAEEKNKSLLKIVKLNAKNFPDDIGIYTYLGEQKAEYVAYMLETFLALPIFWIVFIAIALIIIGGLPLQGAILFGAFLYFFWRVDKAHDEKESGHINSEDFWVKLNILRWKMLIGLFLVYLPYLILFYENSLHLFTGVIIIFGSSIFIWINSSIWIKVDIDNRKAGIHIELEELGKLWKCNSCGKVYKPE